MILRNGINSNLRARGRTALFAGAIFALTVLLTLSIGIWSYCTDTLNRLDKTYTSTALVEYLGADYPADDVADLYARQALNEIDLQTLAGLKGVELWQSADRTLARATGFSASIGALPYKAHGVVYCTSIYPYYEHTMGYVFNPETGRNERKVISSELCGYNALLAKNLYTLDGSENIYIRIEPGEVDFAFEEGQRYLLHGVFVASDTSIKKLRLEPFPGGEDALPYLAVDSPNDSALTDSRSLFVQYADLYRTMNSALEITASDRITALEAFHQGALTIAEGRVPNANEAGVCLVSGRAALQMGLRAGDTLTLELLPADEANRYTGYKTGMQLEQRTFSVVGITSESSDYPNNIWVSGAEGSFDVPLFGYLLGQAVLENETAQQTAETMQAMMPDQVRVTLYDQGYAAVAAPLKTMRTAALVITLASAAAALATLLLFAYLFVGRQQETVALLHALGTPKPKITLWMLSGAGVIAGSASVLGGIVGGILLNRVVQLALKAAQSLYEADLRYSEKAVGLQLQTDTQYTASPLSALLTAALVLGTAMVLCLLFLRSSQKQQAPRRGQIRLRIPAGGTSLWGQGALRYAVLALRRSGARSLLAGGAAFVLALLLGILAGTSTGWQTQLDELYENSHIEGQAVSTDGRTYSELAVSAATARQLWKSGCLEQLSVSQSYCYAPVWSIPEFSDTGFGEETRLDWFYQQDSVVFLNSLTAAPEFYYSEGVDIVWLDGWDERFLSSEEVPLLNEALTIGIRGIIHQHGKELSYPALVSERFLLENGLGLDDSFPVTIYYEPQASYCTVNIHIVGSYTAQSSAHHIYLPLKGAFDPQWLFGEEDVVSNVVLQRFPSTLEQVYDRVRATTFETLRFTLAEATELEQLRSFMAENSYSSVGKLNRNRTTILLRDGAFTQSASDLNRYITFSRLLTPVLLAVVSALGFIISWLMINGRRMECAVMRGMGASRTRVFFSFFWEQALLCVVGCLAAGMVLSLFGSAVLCWAAVGVFALCYLLGTAISVLAVGRTGLMELLSERE